MNRLLTDSSFLFALFSVDDVAHRQAKRFITDDRRVRLMPDVILPEVTFLMNRAGGTLATAAFLRTFAAAQPVLEPLTAVDVVRAGAIMATYASAHFDFVDCCIMALAERLN